jgi:hypothetical protein
MPRRWTALLAVAMTALAPVPARANGDASWGGPPTVFERFVLSACAPCLRENYPIAALPVPAQTLPWLPSGVPGAATRAGELRIDVLRAQQPWRADWHALAVRVTVLVSGGAGGDRFRLGAGLLDGVDAGALAQAVAEMARVAAAAPPAVTDAGASSVDLDYHGGSLRIGLLRLGAHAVGYVQAGDLPTLLQRAIWEVPVTLYLPPGDLPALAAALAQAAARVEHAR